MTGLSPRVLLKAPIGLCSCLVMGTARRLKKKGGGDLGIQLVDI